MGLTIFRLLVLTGGGFLKLNKNVKSKNQKTYELKNTFRLYFPI